MGKKKPREKSDILFTILEVAYYLNKKFSEENKNSDKDKAQEQDTKKDFEREIVHGYSSDGISKYRVERKIVKTTHKLATLYLNELVNKGYLKPVLAHGKETEKYVITEKGKTIYQFFSNNRGTMESMGAKMGIR